MPDNATTRRFELLLSEYLEGELSQEASGEFVDLLDAEPEFTAMLSEQLAMDARLMQFEGEAHGSERFFAGLKATLEAEAGGGEFVGRVLERATAENESKVVFPKLHSPRFWTGVAAAAIVVLAVVFLKDDWLSTGTPGRSEEIARIGELQEPVWLKPTTRLESGDLIRSGQRIELSSGSAELLFRNGARLEIVGPAIVETQSDKKVFLVLGEVHLVAETAESKGFTVETPGSTFVDISTAFSAAVSPDGLSRLDVIEGEVDVVLEGAASERFRRGQTLYVEPGEQRILTRIESGDGTPAFGFPTIAPPSRDDYADRSAGLASIRVTRGKLRKGKAGSGPASVLLDGTGQSEQDAPSQSAFFETGTGGQFLIDLGQEIAVSKIQSYSWHQHGQIEEHRERARQRFTLYGFSGDELPDPDLSPEVGGGTRIARVNSDAFFRVNERLDRPAQQACSIYAAQGEIGRYRYLLWDVKMSSFYGELDVFGTP